MVDDNAWRGVPGLTLAWPEIDPRLGPRLPASARTRLTHWYGYDGTALGRHGTTLGRTAGAPGGRQLGDLTEERIVFVRGR